MISQDLVLLMLDTIGGNYQRMQVLGRVKEEMLRLQGPEPLGQEITIPWKVEKLNLPPLQ